MFMPVSLLFGLFLGLASLALPILGAWLLWKAAHPPIRYVREVPRETKHPHKDRTNEQADVKRSAPATSRPRPITWAERWREPAVLLPLLAGAFFLLLPLFGRPLVEACFHPAQEEPVPLHGEAQEVTRPDGTRIHIESFGPKDAPPLVFNHGWGTDSTEWFYAKRHLAGRFHLILWDLPGLGQSQLPSGNTVTLEQMASDLHAVLSVAGGKPVILVGHSIGGMINLIFCRLYPEALGTQVAGIVQVDTSYTNPVKTTKNSSLNLALQKPVGEPVLHAMIALSPLFQAMNWLSFQEGISQMNNASSGFDGSESRGQVDLIARYQYQQSPAVVAKGTLAMFHWDATPVLSKVNVPVLILVGKDDTTTLPSASQFMQQTIPHAQLEVIDPSRHYALLEQNEKVDSAIAQFASQQLK